MRVALVSPPFLPNFCRSQRWPVVNRTRAMRYPDWLAYAAGVALEAGFETVLKDAIAEEASLADVAKWCGEWKPGLLVLDATTPSIYNDVECARLCKPASPQTHVTLVGPHVSVYPRETLAEAKGRGFHRARRIRFHDPRSGGGAGGRDGVETVDGVSFRTAAGEIVGTGPGRRSRTSMRSRCRLAFLDVKKYRNHTYLYPFLDQISGRGCPNRCTFCQWPQVMHGRRYRYCSPERVVREMVEDFERYPIQEIFFEDDTLTTDRQRLRQICELILQQKRRMIWSCNSRVDWADLDLMS
jgi:hypothetical protein